jgi:hypothetical protein
MTPLQALLHALNLLLPGLMLGLVAAALSKLLWRRALRGVPLLRLAGWAAGAATLAALAGLVLSGRDGAMLTYLAMILASAAALAVVGFGRRSGA